MRCGFIKLRLLFSCLVVLGIIGGVAFVFVRPILARRVSPAEQEMMAQQMLFVNETIKGQLRQLQATHTKWARSDATYACLKNHGSEVSRNEYERQYLLPSTLAKAKVDYVFMIDGKEISFLRRAISRISQHEISSFPDNLLEDFKNLRQVGNDFLEKPISALLFRPDGIYFIVSAPITHSNGTTEVDVQGVVVFVRQLKKADMEAINNEVRMDVKLASVYDTNLYPELSEILETLSASKPIAVRSSDGVHLTAYMKIRDFAESNDYVLVGTRPR